MSLLDISRPTKTYHQKSYDRISPAKAKFDGKRKTVLITAGATGVGRAISTSFAQAGISRIVIVSRSPGPQEKAKKELTGEFPNLEVLTFLAATTDAARVEEVIKSVGQIDVLVLSAAATHPHIKTLDIPAGEVADTFTTNIIGNFNITRAYLAQPSPAFGKTVIHVSSAASHLIIPGQVGYGPSKGGFSQVIQHLAAESTPAKDNVRMFNFHPGAFLTDMAKKTRYDGSSFEWEDISVAGDFAVWLASEESTFLHGRFLWAQWDVDELIALKERVEKDPFFLTIGLVL